MRSFVVPGSEPAEFVERVRRELAQHGFADAVSLFVSGGELIVRFSKLGTSELRYVLKSLGDGFQASLVAERISPFHLAFKRAFEEKFEQVVAYVGGQVN